MIHKTNKELALIGQAFSQWFEIEVQDGKAKERQAWIGQPQEWESQGKPITRHEAVRLLSKGSNGKSLLSLEEIKEIMDGTSPILDGFRLVNEDGSPFVAGEGQ